MYSSKHSSRSTSLCVSDHAPPHPREHALQLLLPLCGLMQQVPQLPAAKPLEHILRPARLRALRLLDLHHRGRGRHSPRRRKKGVEARWLGGGGLRDRPRLVRLLLLEAPALGPLGDLLHLGHGCGASAGVSPPGAVVGCAGRGG